MYRLDGVDAEVKSYFAPVASLLLSQRDPHEALQAALAALSGITQVPEPRSLLTMEEGVQTLLLLSKPGRIDRPAHVRCAAGLGSWLLGLAARRAGVQCRAPRCGTPSGAPPTLL